MRGDGPRWAMSTGTVIDARIVRVTPPITSSRAAVAVAAHDEQGRRAAVDGHRLDEIERRSGRRGFRIALAEDHEIREQGPAREVADRLGRIRFLPPDRLMRVKACRRRSA